MRLRQAKKQDAAQIHQLIAHYAQQGLLLPRSLEEITAHAAHFIVAEREGTIIGCAALEPYHDDLSELRSLAVAETERGRGTGAELLTATLRRARRQGIARVFAVTQAPRFFLRGGFRRVREALPEKIARDCLGCARFGHCGLETVVASTGVPARPTAPAISAQLPIWAS